MCFEVQNVSIVTALRYYGIRWVCYITDLTFYKLRMDVFCATECQYYYGLAILWNTVSPLYYRPDVL